MVSSGRQSNIRQLIPSSEIVSVIKLFEPKTADLYQK
jgi:hypothetical protein